MLTSSFQQTQDIDREHHTPINHAPCLIASLLLKRAQRCNTEQFTVKLTPINTLALPGFRRTGDRRLRKKRHPCRSWCMEGKLGLGKCIDSKTFGIAASSKGHRPNMTKQTRKHNDLYPNHPQSEKDASSSSQLLPIPV